MDIPGLYTPALKLEVARFFPSRTPGEPPAQNLDSWRTWSGVECARFVADVCQLPQYGEVVERNLTGAYLDELLEAGLLSKGLAKLGIGDFEHVRQITTAIQKLDIGGRLGVSMGSPTSGKSSYISSKEPRKKPTTPSLTTMSKSASAPALPKLKSPKPKLIEQVAVSYDKSYPEYERKLKSPMRKPTRSMIDTSSTWVIPNACPVVVPFNPKPVNYLFDGRHSKTVTFLRRSIYNKSLSEAAIRAPYWTSGRPSFEPWSHGGGHTDFIIGS
jgi:hypothetical protein